MHWRIALGVPMFVLIDNYDSFTYNLYHYLGELGVLVAVHRNDAITPKEVLALRPEGIIMSPGPCTPNEAGICLDLVAQATGKVPLLGVCLGHQAIGQAFGGEVIQAPTLMHGKVSNIRHTGEGIFAGIPSPFEATRYHSLIVASKGLPKTLKVTAMTEGEIIMGLQHVEHPIYGVQFHPESIASEYGRDLLANFIALARQKRAA